MNTQLMASQIEDEGFDRPFRFIVTGQYLSVHYHSGRFELQRDYHARGTLFYLSDNEEKIIHDRRYIGALTHHPSYPGDVFYICQGSQYLVQGGQWTDNVSEAVIVQIDPQGNYGDAEQAIPPPLSSPVVDAGNPISADGIDLYHPQMWFSLYPITGDSIWLGDAQESSGMLYFSSNAYSMGMYFQLSKHEEKIRIRSGDGLYLSVIMEPTVAEYLDESCKQHTWRDRCPQCMNCYSLGFSSEPQMCLSLVPKGLPSMFVFHDGFFYYDVEAIKGSYAMVGRVEDIDEATVFQFVG
ncbi:hypothetical protein BDW71DRAFT_188212 [Aspergillus fruticulosus]